MPRHGGTDHQGVPAWDFSTNSNACGPCPQALEALGDLTGDLVVTADIPLAAEVLAKGGAALHPRGERYSEATIRERLTMRDFKETLRASGVQTGGPDSLSQRDRQQFAAELEKWLLAVKRRQG